MEQWKSLRRKAAACLLVTGVMVPLYGGTAAAAESGTTQNMEAEIQSLTQRLNALEEQLKAEKKKDAETKAQEKKHSIHWSGSTKYDYWTDSSGKTRDKNELKLYGNMDLDGGFHVQAGLKYKQESNEPATVTSLTSNSTSYSYPTEKNKVRLEAANVSKDFGNGLKLTLGTQEMQLGRGLWVSKGGINALKADYNVTAQDHLQVSYGRDSEDYLANDTSPSRTRLLKYIDYRHTFKKDAYAGLYYGSQQPDTYLGVYGEAPLTGKWRVAGEYIRGVNSDKGTPGITNAYGYAYTGSPDAPKAYAFDLTYGRAKKSGSWEASLQWLRADQNMFMDNQYTSWDDFLTPAGFQGTGLIFTYALSNASKLSLMRYWAHTQPDSRNLNSKGSSLAQETDNLFCVQLTTKF